MIIVNTGELSSIPILNLTYSGKLSPIHTFTATAISTITMDNTSPTKRNYTYMLNVLSQPTLFQQSPSITTATQTTTLTTPTVDNCRQYHTTLEPTREMASSRDIWCACTASSYTHVAVRTLPCVPTPRVDINAPHLSTIQTTHHIVYQSNNNNYNQFR